MAVIFLYFSGTQYKCCSIHVHSNKGKDLSDFIVRQTLMDTNNINSPNVLWLLLAVNEHCINTRINKMLQRVSPLWKSLQLLSSDNLLLIPGSLIPSRSFIVG